MLGLKLPTDPRWVNLAKKSIGEILTDHAFCEQKAATQCISLITLYPEKTELVNKLSPIVTEEWAHFRMVLKELEKRGLTLGFQRKDQYVNELIKHLKQGGKKETRLLDKLLFSALIEARSCERFKLLSEHISDKDLQKFYRELMEAEAGHYRLFIDLAKTYSDEKLVKERWQELLEIEADIMKNIELRGDRVH